MERCDAAYKKEVLLGCHDALERRGFKRFRKEAIDWPLENGFHCWVGLNTGLYANYVEINPYCGVHSVNIEKLWTSLKRGNYPAKYDRAAATYAVHLGEIAPSEKVFRFSRSINLETEANRLADLYVRVGLPFARSIANYESILPHLKDRLEGLGGIPERVASCLFLMGHEEEAQSFVRGFLLGHEDYFQGFAIPFLKMVEEIRGKAGSE
jgi:hypothetical protein